MRLFTLSLLLFSLTCTTTATAQLSYDEFEWQVLSWIRKKRFEILKYIELIDDRRKNATCEPDEYCDCVKCECIIDGKKTHQILERYIKKSSHPFVAHIYKKIKAATPGEDTSIFELLLNWNKVLKELEETFIDVKNTPKDSIYYISEKKLKEFNTGDNGLSFRRTILDLGNTIPTIDNAIANKKCYNNYYLGDMRFAYHPHKTYPLKSRKKIISEGFTHWIHHHIDLLGCTENSYLYREHINAINVDLVAFKKDLLAHSKQSPFLFVKKMYSQIHNFLPTQDTIRKVNLILLCRRAIWDLKNKYLDQIGKGEYLTNKELKQIRTIENLYNILNIETPNQVKKDAEIISIFSYLINKHKLPFEIKIKKIKDPREY